MRGPRETPSDPLRPDDASRTEVPHDERTYFESFYRANVRGAPVDRMTIGVISDPEARFHYNAVENALIRALARRQPPPPPPMVEAWRLMQRRAGLRLLDIGSGTGHWIDFFRDVYLVADAYAVEITSSMAAFLRDKYARDSAVRVLEQDVCDPAFAVDAPVDYVTAIGVMFHITDDERWRRALANLRDALKPGGLLFVGGDFGGRTANVQFHRSDSFSTWKEFASAEGAGGEVRVARRLRSLELWSRTAADLGLRIADLVRADREPGITTPENDLLVLEK